MTTLRTAALSLIALAALSACHARRGEDNGGVPGDGDSSKPFSGIAPQDTLHFVGTEPFWGGSAHEGSLTYTTPAKPEGTKLAVSRFAGRNGLGLSGTLDGQAFDMTVTPGTCSDGMSDRRFPFSVTLRIASEVRQGCGWTDSKRFTQVKH
ncbi:COG3650 family protein [Novosphingobium sp. 9U]|uniref:COG3650 family protein n=1 Tax=Novosphingobium sp. 9U TaxID=2653158 RepID=UPI0012EF93E6|nr:hypothetical protein [Novosphingobium sp. 9U]VWX52806.1 conserved exported hypothetical protein [Novosphingobium sp. 9U]